MRASFAVLSEKLEHDTGVFLDHILKERVSATVLDSKIAVDDEMGGLYCPAQ